MKKIPQAIGLNNVKERLEITHEKAAGTKALYVPGIVTTILFHLSLLNIDRQ